ncbi:SDR family oxidoreductase [Euryarchaeota archaeon]|nr:SDR family oxidoreductase [Euryarchaeota archaeon]MDP7374682.1 SDR family oxidoreductase [Candidatus Poseidoniaceae archaeon]|tara:strand:- start:40 stop:768 length:729 start_codon:yes stop_codon:yes gene_type:complete
MTSYLIVGGSSDIAIVTAKKLLEQGSKVTCLARDESRVEELKSLGAEVVVGDALDKESVSAAIEIASQQGDGKISGVAHLVGSIAIRPPHALALDAFNEVITTNLSSAFLTLSMCGKAMLKMGGGRMVFTSSVAGSLGLVNHEAIAAAKGGVESMVRSAAATYAKRGIRVNAVAPGLTDTRLAATILRSDAMREASANMIPLKRINEAEEIATSIHWLLTGAPDNFTGQVMHLDGGMSQILA